MSKQNVVAAIIKKNNNYLIVQRNKKKHLGLKWEFPGGKVDKHESFIQALHREIQEELEIKITVFKKIAIEKYKDETIDITLHYYICNYKKGVMKLNEHENFNWIKKEQFNEYDFAEGDKRVLSKL